MNKILIASNNTHKISEIQSVLTNLPKLKLYSLNDFGLSVNVIEDGITLEENALIKARKINSVLNIPTIADDTGLFVDALNGEPGVYSARYAGENASYSDNCIKLLSRLDNLPKDKRSAKFESVICLFKNDSEYYFFKGICTGKIIQQGKGRNGFGYDPIFVPAGLSKTFAELTDEEKNKISHRAIALEKFKTFFNSSYSL